MQCIIAALWTSSGLKGGRRRNMEMKHRCWICAAVFLFLSTIFWFATWPTIYALKTTMSRSLYLCLCQCVYVCVWSPAQNGLCGVLLSSKMQIECGCRAHYLLRLDRRIKENHLRLHFQMNMAHFAFDIIKATHTHTHHQPTISKRIIYSYNFRIKFPVCIQFTNIFSGKCTWILHWQQNNSKQRQFTRENVCIWCINDIRHARMTAATKVPFELVYCCKIPVFISAYWFKHYVVIVLILISNRDLTSTFCIIDVICFCSLRLIHSGGAGVWSMRRVNCNLD